MGASEIKLNQIIINGDWVSLTKMEVNNDIQNRLNMNFDELFTLFPDRKILYLHRDYPQLYDRLLNLRDSLGYGTNNINFFADFGFEYYNIKNLITLDENNNIIYNEVLTNDKVLNLLFIDEYDNYKETNSEVRLQEFNELISSRLNNIKYCENFLGEINKIKSYEELKKFEKSDTYENYTKLCKKYKLVPLSFDICYIQGLLNIKLYEQSLNNLIKNGNWSPLDNVNIDYKLQKRVNKCFDELFEIYPRKIIFGLRTKYKNLYDRFLEIKKILFDNIKTTDFFANFGFVFIDDKIDLLKLNSEELKISIIEFNNNYDQEFYNKQMKDLSELKKLRIIVNNKNQENEDNAQFNDFFNQLNELKTLTELEELMNSKIYSNYVAACNEKKESPKGYDYCKQQVLINQKVYAIDLEKIIINGNWISLSKKVVDEKTQTRINRLLDKLYSLYPRRIVIYLNKYYKKFGETISEIRNLLDYNKSTIDFLADYGFLYCDVTKMNLNNIDDEEIKNTIDETNNKNINQDFYSTKMKELNTLIESRGIENKTLIKDDNLSVSEDKSKNVKYKTDDDSKHSKFFAKLKDIKSLIELDDFMNSELYKDYVSSFKGAKSKPKDYDYCKQQVLINQKVYSIDLEKIIINGNWTSLSKKVTDTKIQKRINNVFDKLFELYPRRIVVYLKRDHETFTRTLRSVRDLLDYNKSTIDFLADYGFLFCDVNKINLYNIEDEKLKIALEESNTKNINKEFYENEMILFKKLTEEVRLSNEKKKKDQIKQEASILVRIEDIPEYNEFFKQLEQLKSLAELNDFINSKIYKNYVLVCNKHNVKPKDFSYCKQQVKLNQKMHSIELDQTQKNAPSTLNEIVDEKEQNIFNTNNILVISEKDVTEKDFINLTPNIEKIVFDDSVEKIKISCTSKSWYLIQDTSNIKEIVIGKKVYMIQAGILSNLDERCNIIVDPKNHQFFMDEKCLLDDKNNYVVKRKIVLCLDNNIPDKPYTISWQSLSVKSPIKKIIIPEKIEFVPVIVPNFKERDCKSKSFKYDNEVCNPIFIFRGECKINDNVFYGLKGETLFFETEITNIDNILDGVTLDYFYIPNKVNSLNSDFDQCDINKVILHNNIKKISYEAYVYLKSRVDDKKLLEKIVTKSKIIQDNDEIQCKIDNYLEKVNEAKLFNTTSDFIENETSINIYSILNYIKNIYVHDEYYKTIYSPWSSIGSETIASNSNVIKNIIYEYIDFFINCFQDEKITKDFELLKIMDELNKSIKVKESIIKNIEINNYKLMFLYEKCINYIKRYNNDELLQKAILNDNLELLELIVEYINTDTIDMTYYRKLATLKNKLEMSKQLEQLIINKKLKLKQQEEQIIKIKKGIEFNIKDNLTTIDIFDLIVYAFETDNFTIKLSNVDDFYYEYKDELFECCLNAIINKESSFKTFKEILSYYIDIAFTKQDYEKLLTKTKNEELICRLLLKNPKLLRKINLSDYKYSYEILIAVSFINHKRLGEFDNRLIDNVTLMFNLCIFNPKIIPYLGYSIRCSKKLYNILVNLDETHRKYFIYELRKKLDREIERRRYLQYEEYMSKFW